MQFCGDLSQQAWETNYKLLHPWSLRLPLLVLFQEGLLILGVSPADSDSKEYSYNVGDTSLIPGSERPPGEENGNPLRHSVPEDSMDTGAWRATVDGVARSWAQPSN